MKIRIKTRTSSRSGFSLPEIILIVALTGLVMSIAIPKVLRSREQAQITTCISNLRVLESAIQQWAVDNGKQPDALIKKRDIASYLRDGTFPVCPGGGRYRLNKVKEAPVCSEAREGHKLP